LADSAKLQREVIANWEGHIKSKITSIQDIPLKDDLLAYVQAFDFSIFEAKTSLQLVDEHRQTPHFAVRFGGGLPTRPADPQPPQTIAPAESRYVSQLLNAYADHTKAAVPDPGAYSLQMRHPVDA
jgi:hypothetical protein